VLYDPAATGDQVQALDRGVAALADIDDVDLVCAPSLMGPAWLSSQPALERALINGAQQRRNDWFLILTTPQSTDVATWIAGLLTPEDDQPPPIGRPQDAGVYFPWLVPSSDAEPPPDGPVTAMPPIGYVAGIFARIDQEIGVHKAPANEVVEGIVDVVEDVGPVAGGNPILALPGRGIRVWGARTVAAAVPNVGANAFIGVRRLVLTLDRWLVLALDWTVFETNEFRTWVRVQRELTRRLTALFEQGALQGRTPDEAFYVKCDDENNPADVRAAGKLQVDIGVAPAVPNEFITIRLVRSADRITVA
jgi:hypothetical protein